MDDTNKWDLHKKVYFEMIDKGISLGLIHSYEKELIDNLRTVYWGSIPASIMILCTKICNGYCYDRALLVTLGFGNDDFKLIQADIDSIKYNPIYEKDKNDPNYATHCFAERTKSDGTVWVYDTSIGLVFNKELYYEIEHPVIRKVLTKNDVLNDYDYQDIKKTNIEKVKYSLPLILPNIEAAIEGNNQMFYNDVLLEEIKRFKKLINYDGICKEMNDDIKNSDFPKKLIFK